MGDPRAVGVQSRVKRPSLSLFEGKVAADILACPDIDETPPRRKIVQKSTVSEAMVIKVAKKLDLDGLRGFRQGLVDHDRSDTVALHAKIRVEGIAREIVPKVFRTAMQALEKTFAIHALAPFDRAADCLTLAKQRAFCGLGGSAQIARDVSHKVLRIGIRTPMLDDAHVMMSATFPGPEGVAIAVLRSDSAAAQMGAAEVARLVDVVPCATAHCDRKAADANPTRTMRAGQSKRLL